jgi:hypothetical protein
LRVEHWANKHKPEEFRAMRTSEAMGADNEGNKQFCGIVKKQQTNRYSQQWAVQSVHLNWDFTFQ